MVDFDVILAAPNMPVARMADAISASTRVKPLDAAEGLMSRIFASKARDCGTKLG